MVFLSFLIRMMEFIIYNSVFPVSILLMSTPLVPIPTSSNGAYGPDGGIIPSFYSEFECRQKDWWHRIASAPPGCCLRGTGHLALSSALPSHASLHQHWFHALQSQAKFSWQAQQEFISIQEWNLVPVKPFTKMIKSENLKLRIIATV